MTRPLNSDELGAKGEKKFGELCLDARLNPNGSDRDRVGWDYVVHWPLQQSAVFDQRPAPFVCHVQLKTVWTDNDSIKLNLGTLEHIVKDARPAFIVVLKVDDSDLTFTGARVIHIADAFLAEILKRLRQAQINDTPTNKAAFTVSATKWGTPLASVSGANLKATFEAALPEGMSKYGREKERQLRDLGYEKGRMTLHTTIKANSLDEVIDGFLGLCPLRLTEVRKFDTRFGIPVETQFFAEFDPSQEIDAIVSFKPPRLDDCTVIAKRESDSATIVCKAGMFVVPAGIVGPDRLVLEARGKLIRLRIDTNPSGGHASLVFASAPGIEDIRATAADWATYYQLGAWAMTERMSFEIRGRRVRQMPPIMSSLPKANTEGAIRSQRAAEAAEIVEWALLKAHAPGTKLTSTELLRAANELAIVRGIEQTPEHVSTLTFTTIGSALKPPRTGYDMLYLNSVTLGQYEIAYAARTKMTAIVEGEGLRWVSGPLQLAHVRKIKTGEESFRKFAKEARKVTGVQSWFGPGDLQ